MRSRQPSTRTIASSTIAPDIFEDPRVRSVKVIGTSVTLSPCRTACQVFSIWKQ